MEWRKLPEPDEKPVVSVKLTKDELRVVTEAVGRNPINELRKKAGVDERFNVSALWYQLCEVRDEVCR